MPIVSHKEICSPVYSPGKCPRAIIDAVGLLVVKKLVFAAFVAPSIVLLYNASPVRKLMLWFADHVSYSGYISRCVSKKANTPTISWEACSVMMMLAIALAFGFVMPLVIPLTGMAMWAHVAVFRYASNHMNVQLANDIQPSSWFLWFALHYCSMLVMWMFYECDLCGWPLVVVTPIVSVIGCVIRKVMSFFVYKTHGHDSDTKRMLEEPLLERETHECHDHNHGVYNDDDETTWHFDRKTGDEKPWHDQTDADSDLVSI